MDIKWQMAMLIMRARRFIKKTRRNLGVQGSKATRQHKQGDNKKDSAPSGRGLILYQAYGRKADLLEDKQIPSVGVFDEVFLALGWNLEEIQVTWAHLEKKLTRLQT
ncbi:hypothetical protein Tco_1242287 [Tanacetum coccineum]